MKNIDVVFSYPEILERLAQELGIVNLTLSEDYFKGEKLEGINAYWIRNDSSADDIGLVGIQLNGKDVATYEVLYQGMEGLVKFKDLESAIELIKYLNQVKDYGYLNYIGLNLMKEEMVK